MSPDQLARAYPDYRKLVDADLIGWEPFTQFQPWYLLHEGEIFRADQSWPGNAENRPLVVFARRQDNDDCACLCDLGNGAYDVVLIEGWTSGGTGYEIVMRFANLKAWYRDAMRGDD